jgi:hypothetical protein
MYEAASKKERERDRYLDQLFSQHIGDLNSVYGSTQAGITELKESMAEWHLKTLYQKHLPLCKQDDDQEDEYFDPPSSSPLSPLRGFPDFHRCEYNGERKLALASFSYASRSGETRRWLRFDVLSDSDV